MSIRLDPNLLPGLLASIQQSNQQLTVATQQLSSGRSVNQLSDDPAAVASLVGNHNQASQDDQYLQSISTIQARFQVADSSLSSVVTALTSALSLGVEGANGTLTPANQQSVAAEVQGLISQVQSLANTTFQGSYLFSGTAVNTPPFTVNAVANTTTYNGNAGVTSVQLSNGNSVNGNVPGSQLFLNGTGSVFGALQGLNAALLSGANIPAAVTQIQSALTTVNTQRVFYGNVLNQVSQTETFLNQDQINLSTQENTLIGVDPATAATNLAQATLANQALLDASGRILSLPNLLSFLPVP
jgi:flagellar hook-associated protein 3 FlgL